MVTGLLNLACLWRYWMTLGTLGPGLLNLKSEPLEIKNMSRMMK